MRTWRLLHAVIDIGGAGPVTGLVPIATPPQESTSKQSSLTEAIFGTYSGTVELIGLAIFLAFGYGLNRRQCIRSSLETERRRKQRTCQDLSRELAR